MSGDKHLLELDGFREMQIIRVAEFLADRGGF